MTQDQRNIKYKIILAGLLHDIGKFWQRADNPRGKGSAVDDYNINEPLLKHICPPKTNAKEYYPAYIHALWTSKFFEDNLNIFDKVKQSGESLFRVNVFDDQNQFIEDNVANLAACHHNPHTFHQALIQLADWWSSGLDRRKAPTSDSEVAFEKYKDINFGKYPFRKVPLYSIFNMVDIKKDRIEEEENKKKRSNLGFKLSPLSIDKDIFPYEVSNESAQHDLGYSRHWNGFNGEFQKLPTDSWKGFVTSLLYLLKKYTWCIPSSTPDLPYVSLYEHLKSTGGIAGCLYDYYVENEDAFNSKGSGHSLSVNHDHEPLRLVSIDISGIQDFIYNIASAKAYRSLKGRSFYLTLLLDAVVTRFLNKINHSPANIVYASGGKAFILAPNTQKTCDSIKKLQREIEDEIFKEHHGRLYVSLASIPFTYQFSDKKDSNDAVIRSSHFDSLTTLGDLWTALIKKGDHIKNQKFKSLITNESGYNRFFSEKGLKGVESNPDKICAVTGELPNDGQKLKNIGREDNEVFVLPQVAKQTELGEALKDGDYLFKYDKPTGEENNYLSNRVKVHIEPCNLGIHYYLIDESMLAENTAEFRSITSGDGTEVLRVNNSDYLWTGKLKGNDASYGFLFYGGNKQPESKRTKKDGKPYAKTFEELCQFKKNVDNTEETRLGVLRMDVDNLGKVFSSGFPNAYRSFAAYGTLSFMLDMFFSGYLNTIRDRYKDTVTIVYSGGDDVFAIGRWDGLISFGLDVRGDFEKFTGNPTLTLSGGMVLVNPSFPISKAADMAGDEEKKSKSGDKDAFVFFGERVQWGAEFQKVQDLKVQFVDLVTNDDLTRSILHQMQKYKVLKDEGERQLSKGGKKDWSYKWHSAYHLGRYSQRYKNKNKIEIKEFVDSLSNGIIHNGKPDPDRYLDLVALAARWAEYELKIESK